MYVFIRLVLTGIVLFLVLISSSVKNAYKSRKMVISTAICFVFILFNVALSLIPFENQVGGFRTIDNLIKYKHGKCETLYTVDYDDRAFTICSKTTEVIRKKEDRFYIISPVDMIMNRKFSYGLGVSFYGDKHSRDRFVTLSVAFFRNTPEKVEDNKGTQFVKAFTLNGTTYFVGCFKDDGIEYRLKMDGVDIELVNVY